MSVRFSHMWVCISAWICVDLLMMAFGSSLPTLLQFDGRDGFRRDIWVVIFIAWMWLAYRQPATPSPAERSTGEPQS